MPWSSLIDNSTWGADEDDAEELIRVRGAAATQDHFLETAIRVSVSIETKSVYWPPVRVQDLVTGGEDELLIDAGGVASGEGENGR